MSYGFWKDREKNYKENKKIIHKEEVVIREIFNENLRKISKVHINNILEKLIIIKNLKKIS